MVNKVKLVITLYILVGIALALLGFLTLIIINTSPLIQNLMLRLALIAASAFIVLVGVHLVIAGIASLRRAGR